MDSHHIKVPPSQVTIVAWNRDGTSDNLPPFNGELTLCEMTDGRYIIVNDGDDIPSPHSIKSWCHILVSM